MSSDQRLRANEAQRRRWNDPYWTAAWPAREALTSQAAAPLQARLALADGDRVLDVGCGAGAATLALARAVAPAGSVVGADLSEALVARATARAEREHVANVRFVVTDVQTDPVEGAPFTVACSQFGVMFFERPLDAFANLRAHVVEGGRLGFVCWQSLEANPWHLLHAIGDLVPAPAPPAQGAHATGPFALADRDELAALLDGAGWHEVDVEPWAATVEVPPGAIADRGEPAFLGVPEERLEEAEAALDRHVAGFTLANGRCRVPIACLIVTACTRADRSAPAESRGVTVAPHR